MTTIRLLFAVVLATTASLPAWAEDTQKYGTWRIFEHTVEQEEHADYVDGLSYILSGGIALAAGFAGQGVSSDPLEKGVYSLFQSIGIVAIGYGAYSMTVGNDDQLLYRMLRDARDVSDAQRTEMLRIYANKRKEREHKERIVKAITHGMIAALNAYTASQQPRGPVQNGLYFIAGVNALASISYSF